MRHVYTALTMVGIGFAFVLVCLLIMWVVCGIDEVIYFKTGHSPKWKRAHRKIKKVADAVPVVLFTLTVLLVLVAGYLELYKKLWH